MPISKANKTGKGKAITFNNILKLAKAENFGKKGSF